MIAWSGPLEVLFGSLAVGEVVGSFRGRFELAPPHLWEQILVVISKMARVPFKTFGSRG